MSDYNQEHNRAVWFDIPVADLERAAGFYRAVLACGVDTQEFDGFRFGVLEHKEGNGGCLIPKPEDICGDKGLLLYLNVEGRIRDAATKATELGGKLLEEVHPIGPHGYRAMILDSEGNRMVLHSQTDA